MCTATHFATERTLLSVSDAYQLSERELEDLCPTPPIDRERLLDQCLNIDLALMLLDEFATTCPSRLAAFEAALASNNHAAIVSQAHALKGVAGILAADAVMETCSSLESTAKTTDWDQTRNLIQQLDQELRRVIAFIPRLRAKR